MEVIAKECPELKHFEIIDDRNFTVDQLKEVIDTCSKLKTIEIHDCKKFQKGSFSKLEGILPSLCIKIVE